MKKVILVLLLNSCGLSTPGGYVVGTTSYLEEHNKGRILLKNKVESISDQDRKDLDMLVNNIK